MRGFQHFVLIGSLLLVSWLGMMIVHEGGHAVGAWLTGGTIQKIVLPVVGFSRTDVLPNPKPLIVVWAGPVVGSLAPLLAFAIVSRLRMPGAYLVRFFAGFCLVANGAYIGAGSFDEIGDTYSMLLFGSRMWQLWIFGAIAFAGGLFLWHRLGPDFGLGLNAKAVKPIHAWAMPGILLAIVTAELLLTHGSWRG